jgi:hypothetical protein
MCCYNYSEHINVLSNCKRTVKQVARILSLTHENDFDLDRKGKVPYHEAELARQQTLGSYQQLRSLPSHCKSPYSGHQLLGVQFVTKVETSLCTSACRRRHNCTSAPPTHFSWSQTSDGMARPAPTVPMFKSFC